MNPEQIGDHISIIEVSPPAIFSRAVDIMGGHDGQSGEPALVLEAEFVGHDHRNEADDGQATVAEDSDHSRAVEKATNDQEDSVDGHEDQDKASQGVDHRPVAALLLAVAVARCVDLKLQGCGCGLVNVGTIDELDVVVGGVLPKGVCVLQGVDSIVLNILHVSPILHLDGTQHEGGDESEEGATHNQDLFEEGLTGDGAFDVLAP